MPWLCEMLTVGETGWRHMGTLCTIGNFSVTLKLFQKFQNKILFKNKYIKSLAVKVMGMSKKHRNIGINWALGLRLIAERIPLKSWDSRWLSAHKTVCIEHYSSVVVFRFCVCQNPGIIKTTGTQVHWNKRALNYCIFTEFPDSDTYPSLRTAALSLFY